jgi:hypothetical protein
MNRTGKSDQYAFNFSEIVDSHSTVSNKKVAEIISLEDIRFEQSRKALLDSFRSSDFFRVLSHN